MTISLPQLKLKTNGLLIYEGPSLLDGKPIIAVATGMTKFSQNPKTGNMIQTWILRRGFNPVHSVYRGQDVSVCGDCKHRTVDGWGTCYVNVSNAPFQVWKSYKAGQYPAVQPGHLHLFKNRILRMGSYGDPVAIPIEVWQRLLDAGVTGWTGYTHQWQLKKSLPYRKLLMASVDSEQEMHRAQDMGWRTFRVRVEGEPVLTTEFDCPAALEAGKRLTCEQCLACNGGTFNHRHSTPTIVVHGYGWKSNRFRDIRERQHRHQGYADLLVR
jgi:hypothetical protein